MTDQGVGAPQPPVAPVIVIFARRQHAFAAGIRPGPVWPVVDFSSLRRSADDGGCGAAGLRRRAATCAASAKEAAQAAAPGDSVALTTLAVDGRAARMPAPIVPARIASHPPAGPSGPARRRRALEAVKGIVTSQDRQDHKIRPCRLCAVGDDVPSRPGYAVPVIGVSLVPPHPARLLVHVYLGVRVARPGADHRSGRALEWRVFVTAEWQGYFGAGPVGRCTRTLCLSPVRHVCLSGQAPRSAAHHLRRRMGGCGSWQSPM